MPSFPKNLPHSRWPQAFVIACALFCFSLAQSQETKPRRVALVIGNAAYQQAKLVNPVNDARAMAVRLRTLGFEVVLRENFKTLHKLSPLEIMNRSVNQTLSRTIITSFVALLTVLALYFFGGDSLKGMAESQILGIVIGTLSSIFVACPLLLLLGVTKQDLMPKARDEEALNARP
jgi:hypothetical protein